VTVDDSEVIPENFESINEIKSFIEKKNTNLVGTGERLLFRLYQRGKTGRGGIAH